MPDLDWRQTAPGLWEAEGPRGATFRVTDTTIGSLLVARVIANDCVRYVASPHGSPESAKRIAGWLAAWATPPPPAPSEAVREWRGLPDKDRMRALRAIHIDEYPVAYDDRFAVAMRAARRVLAEATKEGTTDAR